MKLLHLILFAVSTTLCLAGNAKPNLNDPATLKQIRAEAIDYDDLKYGEDGNEKLIYAKGSPTPYTGWTELSCGVKGLQVLEHYKDGKTHGIYTEWHKNRRMSCMVNYKNGKKHGLDTRWDNEGNVTRQVRYENGQQVETIK